MRVSLKWLREYVDPLLPPDDLAGRITMAGCEVSRIERIGAMWQKIYVARVTALAPHPNADRLQLVTVDYGRDNVTVVAGAFNIKVGDKVPLALEGAQVFDPYAAESRVVAVKATKLRGVLSAGMVCSAKELGISDDHSGILVLDPDAELGRALQDELGDVIFELEVTPNRPDLLSMLGVARETSALTGQPLRLPSVSYEETGQPADSLIKIEILDPDLCSRYTGICLQNIAVGPSPKWLRERLIAAGMRPINNVVDVTNYVMLEWGQPLHAFDYDKLHGRRIIVRRGRTGETMTSLDGVERQLTPEMLVIADAEGAVAIAGIMGGADSEVGEATRNILLESANFNPISIRRTSRALRLPSEASRRFEKGLPPEQTVDAARRATGLLHELAGGQVAKGAVDCYPSPREPRFVSLTTAEVHRLLGIDLDHERIVSILSPLGFASEVNDHEVTTRVPIWRQDVGLPADLAEEIARMIGYDAIPSTTLSGAVPKLARNEVLYWEDVIRQVFVGAGFSEIICYSLTSRTRLAKLVTTATLEEGPAAGVEAGQEDRDLAAEVDRRLAWTAWPPLALMNPLSEDSDSLRTTGFVSLLESLRDNLRHEARDVLLFEIGRTYVPRADDLPEERRIVTAATGALRSGRGWGGEDRVDFFDLKGLAEVLLTRLGVAGQEYRPLSHPVFQKGRSAAILISNNSHGAMVVGVVGEVAAQVRRNFDIDEPAYLLALDLDRLLPRAVADRRYEPLPRYPAVLQDVALLVGESVPAAQIREIIFEVGAPLVSNVHLFDFYRGAPVPADKKSLAYRLTFQSSERTLTDEEVNRVRQKIVAALAARIGAVLRE